MVRFARGMVGSGLKIVSVMTLKDDRVDIRELLKKSTAYNGSSFTVVKR